MHVAYACKYLFIVNNKDVRIIVMILIVDFEQVFPITNNLRLGLFYETMVEQGRTRNLEKYVRVNISRFFIFALRLNEFKKKIFNCFIVRTSY